MNILDVNNPPAGVQVYSCGKKSLTDILSYIADPSWGDITHPQTGRNVVIERIGSGKGSSFTIRVEGAPSPIDPSVLDNLIDLDNMIMVPTNEEMAKAFEAVVKELRPEPPSSAIPSTSPPRAIPTASYTPPAQSNVSPPISFEAPTLQSEAELEAKIKELLGS